MTQLARFEENGLVFNEEGLELFDELDRMRLNYAVSSIRTLLENGRHTERTCIEALKPVNYLIERHKGLYIGSTNVSIRKEV